MKTCLSMLLLIPALGWAADPALGYWLVHAEKHHGGVIKLYANGDCLDGRISKLESPTVPASESKELAGQPQRDRGNPDPAKRTQPLEGLQVVTCLRRQADGSYADAQLYRPEDGKTYQGKAELSADGNTLKVRGFIGFSLIGRSQTWTRLPSLDGVNQATFDKARP